MRLYNEAKLAKDSYGTASDGQRMLCVYLEKLEDLQAEDLLFKFTPEELADMAEEYFEEVRKKMIKKGWIPA